MLGKPRRVAVVSADSEGETTLNAFDRALLKAGIGNLNLVKVTSILPPDVQILRKLTEKIPEGSMVPVIMACITSDLKGEKIAAALAIARTKKGPGLVAEYTGRNIDKNKAVEEARYRVLNMANYRGLELSEPVFAVGVDHVVEKAGCALVAVVFID